MTSQHRHRQFLRVIGLALASACSSEVYVESPGSIVNEWDELPPISERLLPGFDEVALFERVSNRLEENFVLPRDLRVRHVSCGAENAFYDVGHRRIRMCDELLAKVAKVTRSVPGLSEEDVLARVHGTWVMMFLHEVGHAFVHMFDLPVLGNEEVAVDGFAALLLVGAGESHMARLGLDYWAALDSGKYDETDFADEHALDLQRYYAGLCLVYGSDPELHADVVDDGLLLEERAEHCHAEYNELLRDWKAVLGPRLREVRREEATAARGAAAHQPG